VRGRSLDLYLCPREAKVRLDIEPDSLIPQLPSPAELRPFPERLSLRYVGHTARVHAVSVHPAGGWLLSASADGTVRLWEVSSGRCERVIQLGAEARCVRWNPNPDLAMAAAAVGHRMLLLLPLVAGAAAERASEMLEAAIPDSGTTSASADDTSGVPWARPDAHVRDSGVPWEVSHVRSAASLCWHHKGDYVASVAPEGASRAVLLHQAAT